MKKCMATIVLVVGKAIDLRNIVVGQKATLAENDRKKYTSLDFRLTTFQILFQFSAISMILILIPSGS